MWDGYVRKTDHKAPRCYELDLLKALSAVAMIYCHPVIRLGIHRVGYEGDPLFLMGDVVLGDYLGVAHAFMLAMGMGVVYTRKRAPADLMRRGARLYLLGYVLNFCRYGAYALAEGILSGAFEPETLEALFGPDILQFAGLALVATGVLRGMGLGAGQILAFGIALSAFGSALPFVRTGSFALDWLIGHFVVTSHEASCFAFCNWYVFVAAGQVLGTAIRTSRDQDRLYARMGLVCGCVMASYLVATFAFGPLFLCRERNYYAVSTPEAAGLLSLDLTFLAAFHVLLRRCGTSWLRIPVEMSRNLTAIYFIHWCILGFVDSVFSYLLGITFSWPAIYGMGTALVVASFLLARLWRRWRWGSPSNMADRASETAGQPATYNEHVERGKAANRGLHGSD